MSEPFLGQITLFPYSFAPLHWADCQGQLLPINQYAALFSLLGTSFGGNGTTNFALPDLQGRVVVGMGTAVGGSDYIIGEPGGTEQVSINQNMMGAHSHPLNATTSQGTTNAPAGTILATVAKGTPRSADKGEIYNTGATDTTLVPASLTSSGGALPHNNVQPSLTLRYCIALNGVFPQRP
jgi:microcystin-dependent protein